MFDLEQAVANWRRQLAAGREIDDDALNELESHLREAIEERVKEGKWPQPAFESAVEALGDAAQLKREFHRAQPAVVAIRWLIAAIFCAGALFAVRLACLPELTSGWRIAGFLNAIALIGAILGRGAIVSRSPVVPSKQRRDLLGVACGLLAMAGAILFMNFVLPKLSLTEPQVGIVVLWSLTVMTFVSATGATLDAAAKRQQPETQYV